MTGRRPPPQAALCGLDGCEHGATLDLAGSRIVLPGHGSFRGWTWHRNKAGTSMSRTQSAGKSRRGKREVANPRPGWDGSRLDQADLVLLCGCGRGIAPIKVAILLPNVMHDDGQFLGNRNLGATHADAGERDAPCLELRRFCMTAEQNVGASKRYERSKPSPHFF